MTQKTLSFNVGIKSPPFDESGRNYTGRYMEVGMVVSVFDWSKERYDEVVSREAKNVAAQVSLFLADGWTIECVSLKTCSDQDAIELVKFGRAEIRFRPENGGSFNVYKYDSKSPSGVTRVWGWGIDKADWIHEQGVRTHLSQVGM